jgi:hypothetical protein
LDEFTAARNTLLLARAYAVRFHSDPAVHHPKPPHLMSCFTGKANSKDRQGSRQSKCPAVRKGYLTMQQHKQSACVTGTCFAELSLVVELYALDMILLSRTQMMFRDIIEIRSGNDAHHLRKLQHIGSNAMKMVTIFSRERSLEVEFDSTMQQHVFVDACRKVSVFCRQ